MTKREAEAIKQAIQETVRHVFYAMTALKVDTAKQSVRLDASAIEELKSEVEHAIDSALEGVVDLP